MATPNAPLFARADVVITRVTGAERLTYLDAVLTQQLADLLPGSATSALLLDAHGAPLLVLDLAVEAEAVLLVAPADCADEVDRLLAGRTFLADARFERLPSHVAIRTVGASAAEVVADALETDVVTQEQALLGEDVVLGLASGVLVVTTDPERVTAALTSAGAEPGDPAELEAWDVANGVPTWGQEIAKGNLPEEVGLLATHVHLAKGCYPGQEAVARMWMLGRPRRRLAVVRPDPAVAAGWTSGGGRRGASVTRVADGPEGSVALAFVPGDADEGDRFEDEDGTGVQVATIVGADGEVRGHDPKMVRRRDRR